MLDLLMGLGFGFLLLRLAERLQLGNLVPVPQARRREERT